MATTLMKLLLLIMYERVQHPPSIVVISCQIINQLASVYVVSTYKPTGENMVPHILLNGRYLLYKTSVCWRNLYKLRGSATYIRKLFFYSFLEDSEM